MEFPTVLSVAPPRGFNDMTPTQQEDVIAYLHTLDEVEQLAYTIALEQLGTSFDLLRFNGFCDWKKARDKQEKEKKEKAKLEQPAPASC